MIVIVCLDPLSEDLWSMLTGVMYLMVKNDGVIDDAISTEEERLYIRFETFDQANTFAEKCSKMVRKNPNNRVQLTRNYN